MFNELVERGLSMAVGSVTAARRIVRRNPEASLIPGHKIDSRRVKAYETHWISGFEFTFAIIPWPYENFRIYILKSPSYGRRSASSLAAHWLPDAENAAKYICIEKTMYPQTLTDARNLALMWSQATARYIKTGVGFS